MKNTASTAQAAIQASVAAQYDCPNPATRNAMATFRTFQYSPSLHDKFSAEAIAVAKSATIAHYELSKSDPEQNTAWLGEGTNANAAGAMLFALVQAWGKMQPKKAEIARGALKLLEEEEVRNAAGEMIVMEEAIKHAFEGRDIDTLTASECLAIVACARELFYKYVIIKDKNDIITNIEFAYESYAATTQSTIGRMRPNSSAHVGVDAEPEWILSAITNGRLPE